MMQHRYYMGKSFGRAAVVTYSVSVAIFILGCIVYSLYFVNVSKDVWVAIFSIVCVAVLLLERKLFRGARAAIYYELSDEGLLYRGIKNMKKLYRWEDFTQIETERFVYDRLCNIRFTCGGETFIINKYIEDPCGLACEIMDRIEPYVSVNPEIKKKMAALSGISM